MTRSSDNNRRFSRVPFDTETLLSSDQQCWRCHLIDISMKGALIEPPPEALLKLEQTVQLEVNLDHSGIAITMDMSVAHNTGNRIGLKCIKIDAESISHLRRLIELNLGDADLVNRELLQLGE